MRGDDDGRVDEFDGPVTRMERAREVSLLVGKTVIIAVLFVLAFFYPRIFRDVYTGEMGVKWSRLGGGTVLNATYGEGMHLTWPWDEFYIYDMREQEVRQETVIYAKDGLEIHVRSSIRFRPTADYLPHLHQDLGPNYVEKVVKPEAISTMRKVLGNYTPELIYAKDEEGLLAELGRTLREDLNSTYFEVTEFLVLELRLPVEVEGAIKAKLIEEQKMLSYRFRLERERDEKERRIIEAEGLRAFEAISGLSILRWRGIEATEHLADSPSSKIILMGTGEGQLPVILNADAPVPGGAPTSSSAEATSPRPESASADTAAGPAEPSASDAADGAPVRGSATPSAEVAGGEQR